MAKKKGSVINIAKLTTSEFAKLVGITKETVCDYCLRIRDGQEHVLQDLKKEYGLTAVKKVSNKWVLTIETTAK